MTPLALSALTDVILACLVFFLAGLSMRNANAMLSPAWWWSVTLCLLGFSTMLGAIDHGFLEGVLPVAHHNSQLATRSLATIASYTMLIATAGHFLVPFRSRVVVGIGGIVTAIVLWQLWETSNFLIMMAAYSVVLVIVLAFHLGGLRNGTGSLWMCAGIVIIFGASALVIVESQGFFGLGLFGTYHVILMPAMLALFLGGRRLRGTVRRDVATRMQAAVT